MTTTLVRQSETIPAFHRRIFFWIEAFVDHDPGLVEEDRAEDVRVEARTRTRNAEAAVGIVELDSELQVFLDDIFDGNRRCDHNAARLLIFGQQRRCIALDLFLGQVGHNLGHRAVILICICIIGNAAA